MRKLIISYKTQISILIAACVIGASSVLLLRAERSVQTPAPAIPGVPPSVWAQNSMQVHATSETAKISREVLEQAATSQFAGFTLRGSVLARVAARYPSLATKVMGQVNPPTPALNGSLGASANAVSSPPVTNRLVWIVSLAPAPDFRPLSGPGMNDGATRVPPAAPSYFAAIYDASSGEFLTVIFGG